MKKLKTLRIDNNINLKELSSLLNLNEKEYLKLENDETKLFDYQLIKLSDFYSVSIDYLLGLTDIPDIYPKK